MTRGSFPTTRLRRNRSHSRLRDMVRETTLGLNDLILPLFVRHGTGIRNPISSMPGNDQMSIDVFREEIKEIRDLGIPGIVLFGIPDEKDENGSETWNDEGIIQQAVRSAKEIAGDQLLVITDVCFCEYTSHGHCGVLEEVSGRTDVSNDKTLDNLALQAASHARSGADMIAPSGMMDGMVQAIRAGLDSGGFDHIPIMSYAAKYASGFYGPFREAAESAPQFGDRRTYQMDPANSDEALREVALDIQEGADIVMVKPAMAYLDIIRRIDEQFPVPIAAYNVSGEFAMVKAAASNGWIDEQRVTLELLTSIKRAGASMILTYFAKDVARWMA